MGRTILAPCRRAGAALLVLVTGVRVAPAQTAEVYDFDVAHATLEFAVRLVGFNRVRGAFEDYRGAMLVVGDDPTRSAVSLAIDVASVRTGTQERDDHLRSDAFFDAQRWPRMTFTSDRIERGGDGFVAVGPLTIRDVTREVRVPFTVVAPKGVDPFGNTRFSVAGRIVIDRRTFGVVGPAFWNRAISDSVEIEFEMPGRRWTYAALGWGAQRRASAGQALYDAIGAKGADAAVADGWALYTAHRADSTYNFAAFEYDKAAGRLAEQGKVREAIAALELGVRVADDGGMPVGRANLRVQLAQLYLRAGDRARAAEHAGAAARLDPTNPAALLLARHLGARTGAGTGP